MNIVRGMEREAAWRIQKARAIQAFSDINDLEGRALASLTGNRRQAMWQAAGSVPDKGQLRSAVIVEEARQLEAPSEAQNIVADYRHLGLTFGRHPLLLLRVQLTKMRFIAAADLSAFGNGQPARMWNCHSASTVVVHQWCGVCDARR
jgi:error-prone DNA polymerase